VTQIAGLYIRLHRRLPEAKDDQQSMNEDGTALTCSSNGDVTASVNGATIPSLDESIQDGTETIATRTQSRSP
jgi:hypothetical protein